MTSVVPVRRVAPKVYRAEAIQLPSFGDAIGAWDDVCAFFGIDDVLHAENDQVRIARPRAHEVGLVVVTIKAEFGDDSTTRAVEGDWVVHNLDDDTWAAYSPDEFTAGFDDLGAGEAR